VGSSVTTPVTVTVTTAGVLGSISARMMGAENLDFTNAGGGSCTVGTSYAVNTTCTVNVGFAPKLAGQRRGAVVLLDASGNVLGTEYVQGTGNGPQAVILTGVGLATGIVFISGGGSPYPAIGLAVDGNDTVWQVTSPTEGLEFWTFANGKFTGPSRLSVGEILSNQDGGELAFDGAGFPYYASLSEQWGRLVPTAPGGGVGGSGYQVQSGCGNAGATFPISVATDGGGNAYVMGEDGQVDAMSYSTGVCTPLSLPFGWFTNGAGYASPTSQTIDPSGNLIASLPNVPGSSCAGTSATCLFEQSDQQGSVVTTQIATQLINPESPVSDGAGNLFVVAAADPQNPSDTTNNVSLATPWPGGALPYRNFLVAGSHTGPLALDGNGNLFTDGGAYEFNLLNPSPVSFPSTGQGQSSPRWLITVANTGNAPLTITSVTYPTDFPEATGVSGECAAGQTVAVGGFCTITVVFSPTSSLNGESSQTLSETVKLVSNSLNGSATEQDIPVTGTETLPVPTIALTSSADPAASGSAVTFTATLTPAKGVAVPTGSVTFLDGKTTLGSSPVGAGTASYTATALADGVHSITAQYGGDGSNAPATSATLTQTIGVSTPVLTWPTPAAITYPTPLGSAQLDATASDAGTMASVAGSFVYSPAAGTVLGAGQQTLTATFTPTNTTLYRPATASVTLTVNPNSPTIALTSSPNPSISGSAVTFTASVTASNENPTGTIAFMNGSSQLGTATLAASGMTATATYSTSALPVGSDSITAAYSGDANFSATTSSALTQVVNAPPPDFSVSITPATASVSPGGTATFTFTATPINGFDSTVSLACSGLPAETTCGFSPSTLSPTGSPATSTLSIVTTAPLVSANRVPELPGGVALAGIGLGVMAIFLIPRRYRSRAAWLPTVLLLAGALSVCALGLTGCGAIKNAINQNTDPGTPKGTYTVTVTGSWPNDGTATNHSATVSLTVQ
jgi:hypothetical protein